MFCDLHNHLYGSLPSELLFDLGKKNQEVRWEIFTNSYKNYYNQEFDKTNFFLKYTNPDEFKKLYHYKTQSRFQEFQVKFDLVIALVQFNETELKQLTQELLKIHYQQKISYIEYRMMFPKQETKQKIASKLEATCEGLEIAEHDLKNRITGRLVVSLHRDENFWNLYDWIKELIVKKPKIRNYLVGIDFCSVEEHNPPKLKKEFFEKVLEDNFLDSKNALSILYHVGESFLDKTPISACRWVTESSLYGVHRLGHALALAYIPDYEGKEFLESIQERKDQLEFEIEHYDQLVNYIDLPKRSILEGEIDNLKLKTKYNCVYTTKEIKELIGFQNYSMNLIRKKGTIIESCPTSNERIAGIPSILQHPLKRFIENDLNVVISTDDPGILDVSIQDEFDKAKSMGIREEDLNQIQKKSFLYKSEILSGRSLAVL